MKLTLFSSDHTRVAVQEIRPLSPLRAVAHFLLAGLVLRGTTYYLLPLLVAQGLAPFEAFVALVTGWIGSVTNGVPMPAMPFRDDYLPAADLRWYGVGAMGTPWYATAVFQLPLMITFEDVWNG